MSVVPHTRTHAVNLADHIRQNDVEAISHADLWEVDEPVQLIYNRNGHTDENLFSYSGPIFDLNQLIECASHNGGRLMNPLTSRQISYDDIDPVRWTGIPSSISWPGGYVGRTERHLAELRRPTPPAIEPHIDPYTRYLEWVRIRAIEPLEWELQIHPDILELNRIQDAIFDAIMRGEELHVGGRERELFERHDRRFPEPRHEYYQEMRAQHVADNLAYILRDERDAAQAAGRVA